MSAPMYITLAIARLVVLMPVALAKDVFYNVTGIYLGNPDWVAR